MEKPRLSKKVTKTKITKKMAKRSAYYALVGVWYSYAFCYKKRKAISLMLLAFILSASVLVSYKYVQAKMEETSSFSDKFILEKVSKHIVLPKEVPLSLVRVEDADKLRLEHPFYKDVKEGDYIIAYTKLFIIYDAMHDEVRAMKESSKK